MPQVGSVPPEFSSRLTHDPSLHPRRRLCECFHSVGCPRTRGIHAAAEPEATEALYLGAGTAPVLEVNFAICGVARVLRQVRAALRRRAEDEAKARSAAAVTLQNELNASLTGLLLESQLALGKAGPDLLPSLHHLIELASELRGQLRA